MIMIISSAIRRVCINQTGRSYLVSSCRRSLCSMSIYELPSPSENSYLHSPKSSLPRALFLPTCKTANRWLSTGDLPYHIVVGMPALSPTMTSGVISKWNVANGDSFSAGDSLAVIETDKATIDFEAQDDGVVAKLLVKEGGTELEVGSPIMVTVEDVSDVMAFKDFVPAAITSDIQPSSATEDAAPSVTTESSSSTSAPNVDLPYHIVVAMPALSPTMSAGTISKWNVSEGQSFAAGDSIAVIETDKASMDFEAQDDGIVAKLLVQAGSGEISVGTPIMVTVEEESDVVSFKNFIAGSAPGSSATEAAVASVVVKDQTQPIIAPSTVEVAPVAAPKSTPVVAQSTIPISVAPSESISQVGSSWGKLAERSPLAKALAAKQKQYIEKYGSTGHLPIV